VEIRQQTQVLATRSAIVCAENRVLAFMLQNRCLASSAHEAAWGLFKAELAQACANRGHLLLESPRFAATTQACPTPGLWLHQPQSREHLEVPHLSPSILRHSS
jgi:hypothetical protein